MADVPSPVQALMTGISAEFPAFKVAFKDESRLMKAIDVFLRIITLNRTKNFLTSFITTVGYTVYVSRDWWANPNPLAKLSVLRHERVHMRQRRHYGMFLFSFLYLFFPLPGGLAYFRMVFEREAYEETLRAGAELCASPEEILVWKSSMVSDFVGPSYFWMWPFKKSVESWFDVAASAAIARAKSLKTP